MKTSKNPKAENDRSLRLQRQLTAGGIAVMTIILLIVGYLLNNQFNESRQLRTQVDQSYHRRIQIERVLSLHQDIETGQRGYILTGDLRFLEPFRRASTGLEAAVAELGASLQSGSAGSRENLARLRTVSADKLGFANSTVKMAQVGDFSAARQAVAGGRGKSQMDAIRALLDAIEADEVRSLQQATARADSARRTAQQLTFGLLAFLALLLYLATWVNGRVLKQRQDAVRRLRGVSARQTAIFDSATDGMLTINRSGSIESLNPAAARMFGYDPEELVRRDIGRLFELGPDQGKIETFVRRLYRQSQAGGSVQEFWGKRRDGSTFPMEASVSRVRLEDQDIYLAVTRDVSERKQVERMKTEFVSTVSHELRTPLTSIAGSLGLLAGGAAGELPDRATRLIKIAHSNSERLVRLINDILDIEKIESGNMVFDLKPVPVEPLITQAIEANRSFADGYGVRISYEPIGTEPIVIADEDRLMQVLTNLLSNAVKFSPRDETVTILVSALDRRWRITVVDRGSGIDEAFKSRIFGKFAQADASDTRQKGGTGLGLSIVKEIITRCGGSVSFDSTPGVGTAFHVDLPAAEISRPQALPANGGAAILHVEDDPDVLGVVASAFEGIADICSVSTLKDAQGALADQRFDIIILDVALPDGPGTLLLDSLKAEDRNIPVVIFSAQDADLQASAGVAAILTKSRASITTLVETVMQLLPRRGKHGRKKK